MVTVLSLKVRLKSVTFLSLVACLTCPFQIRANPLGGSVSQGAASFNTSGSQFTINQSSTTALINWQSFNINPGETTTFVQPSASSVAWNQINDANPSQILGNINANGYVILQNQNGFAIGGAAVINAHGLVMTTSPTPPPDLSGGGPWSFSALPPAAKIVNYGQINIAGGGSAYLIASDIENNGTISAPAGNIGLYAGQQVLVSMSPDGRGLSAKVTLPQGSVDNAGNLIADAGSIMANAQVVNQNGLVQANSVQNVNGTIELVASGSLNLGAGSKLSAAGDSTAASPSPGGFVVLNAGKNTFTDKPGSAISVASAGGGQNGILDIIGSGVSAGSLHSTYGSPYALLLNPYDLTLSYAATAAGSNPTLNLNALSVYSQIDLQTLDNLELSSSWNLPASIKPAVLSLTAGNNLVLDPGTSLVASQGWCFNLAAANIIANHNLLQADDLSLNSGTLQTTRTGDINLQAKYGLELDAAWTLAASAAPASLTLTAGSQLVLGDGLAITAGSGWNLNLSANNLLANNATLVADNLNLATSLVQPAAGGHLSFQAVDNLTVSPMGTPVSGGAEFGSVSLVAGNQVTLAAGSMIEADGGKINVSAPIVEQSGTLQANSIWNSAASIGNHSGTINLQAGSALVLGNGSTISAMGDSTGASAGGSVTLHSTGSFSDQSGSLIDVAGGALGGAGGQVTISAPQMGLLQSAINGHAIAGYADGSLSLDTANITLNSDGSPVSGQLALNVNSLSSGFSQVSLQASGNIEVSSLWNLANKSGLLDTLSLLAGNTISVDAGAGIQAEGGKILLNANTVNQNGLLQANSVLKANGVIEIDAGMALNLGATSVISANGDPTVTSPSPGGFVVLNAVKNTFVDTAGSTISVSGVSGGQSGIIEIFGNGVTAGTVNSTIGSYFAYLINPGDLFLSTDPTTPNTITDTSHPNQYANFNVSSDLSAYTRIDLQALNNIELSTPWSLANQGATIATLGLSAGNNIILDSDSGIKAGQNWSVNLTAGTQLSPGSMPASGSAGIYLDDNAYITAKNGDVNLQAANEVQVGWLGSETPGVANSGLGSITTTLGGNISIVASDGDVNSGSNPNGYQFNQGPAPYRYKVSATLGGISTAAGGNVTITAGGSVTSFLPGLSDPMFDAGSGAFGSQPGNVTVNAKNGNIYGHFVEANGIGTITAQNGNVGSIAVSYVTDAAGNPVLDPNGNPEVKDVNSFFALSLVNGSWTVNAPHGSIYLQEVRNPNGVFNSRGQGIHYFNYGSDASVSLNAGNAVAITGGSDMPRNDPVPIVLPPSLEVTAGSGGFKLYQNMTFYQSPVGNIDITTLNGGDFTGVLLYYTDPNGNFVPGENPQFFMSDSASAIWNSQNNPMIFAGASHAASPTELNNPNPVVINVSGSLNNVDIYTTKATQITVGKDLNNSSFVGENLHPTDVSFVKVAGKIYYSPFYSFQTLGQAIVTVPYGMDNPVNPSRWDTIFYLIADPYVAANLVIPSSATTAELKDYYNYLITLASTQFPGQNIWAFPTSSGSATASNPGFIYNPTTLRLGFGGPMSPTVQDWMNGWNGNLVGNKAYNTTTINGITYGALSVIRLNAAGLPVVQNGRLVLDTVTFVDQNTISQLYNSSSKSSGSVAPGIQIGGPGQLNITAGSMSLGNSQGIESWGIVGPLISSTAVNDNYNSLGSLTSVGAAVDVTVSGDLDMLTSRIASMYGGDVIVNVNGTMDLGSDEVPVGNYANAYGIYTTGHSDVQVTAGQNIEINGSRIAAFNGGNISILSLHGSVDVGSGGNTYTTIPLVSSISLPGSTEIGPHNFYLGYQVYGSGVVATSLPGNIQTPGGNPLPGNITVETPFGNISSSDAGVLQYALNGNTAGGPVINLIAGTPGIAATPAMGNIDLGNSGVIGGTVNLSAQGNIAGLVISRQDSSVNTAGNFNGTVLSAGSASVSAGGSVSGTIIGVGGVSASGSTVDATLLSQNVTVGGGPSESTLGTSAKASEQANSAAATTSDQNNQDTNGTDNQDDTRKKKKLPLLHKISRVTVLLSAK